MGSSLMEAILNGCHSHTTELSVIWDYIGFEEEERTQRTKNIANEVKLLLDTKIATENQFRLEIESEIENKKREVTQLCQQLKIATFFPPRDLSSYNLLKILNEKTRELNEIRIDRQTSFISTYRDILNLNKLMSIQGTPKESEIIRQNLCIIENEENISIDVKDNYVPLEEDIIKCEQYLQTLKTNYTELLQKYNCLLQDVGRIAVDIEYTRESDFEGELLQKFLDLGTSEATHEIDFDKASAIDNDSINELEVLRLKLVKKKAMLLSTCEELRSYLLSMWCRLHIYNDSKKELLAQCSGYKPEVLELLQEEVNKCQQMKWEKIDVYYSGLLEDKEEIEKKLLINASETLRDFTVEDLTEEAVSSLEQEIDQLKLKYEKHQPLYDLVGNYQNLWFLYIDVEKQMKDPNTLCNRGGMLLKTEKEKKRLLKELPKCEASVSEAILEYEKSNESKFFVWNNLSFKEYVEHLWLQFRGYKETTKFRRPTSGSQSVTNSPKRNSVARVK